MRLLSIPALLVVVLRASVAYADLSKIVRVDVASQQYIDAEGRSRHFHGTNMVNKKFPFHKDIHQFTPGRSVVDRDIQHLKDLNVNLVRLGVHWAGVEPERGSYNQTYLDITYTIIKKLQDNGIYTLVDQHQDVWGAQICGHGAPVWFVKHDWVVPEHRMPVPQKLWPFAVADGIPSDADCDTITWGTSYLTYAVANAFGRLYNNYDNLGDSWAAYWSVVATKYHALPGVMGYDLMNEPWAGDHWANPLLLVPGVADHENLEPLWNKGNSAIRMIDNTTIVFFEGVTWDILSGFNNVPGGDGSKTAHSYHFYNPPQLGTIEDTIKNRIVDATRLKTTGMLTEFMLWDQTDKGLAVSLEITRQADRYLQSWTAWAYEELFDGTAGTDHWGPGPSESGNPPAGTTVAKGEPFPVLALIYARTYAEATAGITKTSYFEDTTGKYWVSWVVNTGISAPGLIRIAPKSFYPDGIRVISNPPDAITYTMENENVVRLHYTNSANRYNGRTVLSSIHPFYPTGIITNPASGNKCIDVFKATVLPNNPIILYGCGPRWNQVWKFKNGNIQLAFDQAHDSGKYCLDTSPTGNPSDKFLNIVLNPCRDTSTSQMWTTNLNGNVVNVASGYCVDITASEYKDGSRLLAFPCGRKQANQVWNLPEGVDGAWEVKL